MHASPLSLSHDCASSPEVLLDFSTDFLSLALVRRNHESFSSSDRTFSIETPCPYPADFPLSGLEGGSSSPLARFFFFLR